MDEAKGLIITGIVTLLILGGGIFFLTKGNGQTTATPKPVNPAILIDSNSHQTNPGANVTIVEFGDYRCPACKAAFPAAQQVIKDYGTKINFVFRNYPFLPDSATNSNPTASTLAANAAECAADLGKFWEMHDWFYENQPDETNIKMYNVDDITKAAGTLGMDTTKFKVCLSTKSDNARVQSDYAAGQEAGVTGTPSFFINGSLLPGVPSYQDFKSILDQLLSQKK